MKTGFREISKQKTADIRMRDPFVYTDTESGNYYMFGTTFSDGIGDKEPSFDCYVSEDMENWEGPYLAFDPDSSFWGVRNFWAPEVFKIKDKYYMFATFKGKVKTHRGTGVLISDTPYGPYKDHSGGALTPSDEEALDGTFYQDNEGNYWLIYCHEWTQLYDGEIKAVKLSSDLKSRISKPVFILRASERPWVRKFCDPRINQYGYLTDAPFIYSTFSGELLLLWSSYSTKGYGDQGLGGYTVAIARSISGKIEGPWTHDNNLLLDRDAGHSSLFRDLNGHLYLCTHYPDTPHGSETPTFFSVIERDNQLILLK